MLRKIYRQLLPVSIRKPIRDWLHEKAFHYDAEVEFYGAYSLLLQHLNEKKSPYCTRKKINWQHGWYPDYYQEGSNDPFVITQNQAVTDYSHFNFVARKSEENKLHAMGITNSIAIGLPIVYTPFKKIERIKGSLLVMPGHSLDYISLQTNEDHYLEYINSIKHLFSKITVCIHPSCLRNGYWINTFRNNGYNIVIGVEISNQNAFYRLRKYFSQHEYCTTNLTGSHIIYASFFGCKVSLIGPTPKLSIEDFKNSIHWRDKEDKDSLLHSFNKMSVPEFSIHYPEFVVENPIKARKNIDLAYYECGYDNKITNSQYAEVINWISQSEK